MTSFGEVYSVEWNCAATTNTETFTRSSNCKISGNNHVAVSNTLEIVGSNEDMNNLITITASRGGTRLSKLRNFYKLALGSKIKFI